MPTDQQKVEYLKNFCEPDLDNLVSFSPSFIVTIVKVLVFIDGVKTYVGRHLSTLPAFTHAPALYN
jgi:hypothetical protein